MLQLCALALAVGHQIDIVVDGFYCKALLQVDNKLRGAYFSYCAYILVIWRHSAFVWVVLPNTGIFLRGLKLSEERKTQQLLSVLKKIGSSHAFFRDNKNSI